jgi:hypothetical protein
MRSLSAVIAASIAIFAAAHAYASDIPTHSRTIEWQATGPCDVALGSGEVKLEWADCGGAYALASFGEGENQAWLLFVAGSPDMCAAEDKAAWLWCNRKCCKKLCKDVYCGNCDPCAWTFRCGKIEQCCEEVQVYAWMPDCSALDITNVY